MKKAIISGASGQDGSYLIEILLDKGYEVYAFSRRTANHSTGKIDHLMKVPEFHYLEGDVSDSPFINDIIGNIKPDEFYNLAAMSHVHTSFYQPKLTNDINYLGVLNILSAIKCLSPSTKMYQACHDLKTNVVTKDGIKSFNEVSVGDIVLTINEKTGELQEKKILKKLEYDYSGKMIGISSKRISQLVTPNHKVLLRNDNGSILKDDADSIKNILKPTISDYSLPYCTSLDKDIDIIYFDSPVENNYKNVITSMNPEYYSVLLGLYIGDGHIKTKNTEISSLSRKDRQDYRSSDGKFTTVKSKKTKQKLFTSRVEFSIPKDNKARKLICSVLDLSGIEYKTDDIMVTVSCYGLAKKLSEDAGHYFNKKRINPEIYNYGPKFLKGLIYGLLMSDGDGKKTYFTSNEKLMVDVVKLFFMGGYYPNIQERELKETTLKCGRVIKPKNKAYSVYLGRSGKNKVYSSHIKEEDYTGKVWCLEIEDNHNFMIERNGKIAFSGNSTSELFGKSYSVDSDGTKYQDENTPFVPQSPYAISKLAAHHACRLYRESYGLFVSCGILGNHESPRRGENFLTRKVTLYLGRLKEWTKARQNNFSFTEKELMSVDGERFPKLHLGNLDSYRDWGYAESYMEIAHSILQLDKPDDYVVGTGITRSVRQFVEVAFAFSGISNYQDYIFIDPDLYRPCEVDFLNMRPRKLKEKLGFEFTDSSFHQMVYDMVKSDEKV